MPDDLRRFTMSGTPSAPEVEMPKPPEVSPTGDPLIPPRFVPYLAVLVVLAAVAHEFFPEYAMVARISGAITSAATLLGIVSPGMRKGAVKAIAGLGLLGCLYSTPAMAAPADAPLAEPPAPSPVLAPPPFVVESVDKARCRHLRAREKVFGATATGAKYVTVGLGGAAGGLLAKHLNDKGVSGDTVLTVTLVALATGAMWQVADSLATSYAKDTAAERCPVSAL